MVIPPQPGQELPGSSPIYSRLIQAGPVRPGPGQAGQPHTTEEKRKAEQRQREPDDFQTVIQDAGLTGKLQEHQRDGVGQKPQHHHSEWERIKAWRISSP